MSDCVSGGTPQGNFKIPCILLFSFIDFFRVDLLFEPEKNIGILLYRLNQADKRFYI